MDKIHLNKILRGKTRAGMTLVEMMVVVVILGILGAVFYTTLFMNWSTLTEYITRADLRQEILGITTLIQDDGHHARVINVSTSGSGQKATIIGAAGNVISEYSITSAGVLLRDPQGAGSGPGARILTISLNPDQSGFMKVDRGLAVTLSLQDDIFERDIRVLSTFEVFPRN